MGGFRAGLFNAIAAHNRSGILHIAAAAAAVWMGYTQALFDAIAAHNTAGILFIAAAGNSNVNTDFSNNYPSNYSEYHIIHEITAGD
jgi:hypothetical protein